DLAALRARREPLDDLHLGWREDRVLAASQKQHPVLEAMEACVGLALIGKRATADEGQKRPAEAGKLKLVLEQPHESAVLDVAVVSGASPDEHRHDVAVHQQLADNGKEEKPGRRLVGEEIEERCGQDDGAEAAR